MRQRRKKDEPIISAVPCALPVRTINFCPVQPKMGRRGGIQQRAHLFFPLYLEGSDMGSIQPIGGGISCSHCFLASRRMLTWKQRERKHFIRVANDCVVEEKRCGMSQDREGIDPGSPYRVPDIRTHMPKGDYETTWQLFRGFRGPIQHDRAVPFLSKAMRLSFCDKGATL